MIVTLSQKPDEHSVSLLQKTLTKSDAILLSPGSMPLCLSKNVFDAKGYVRQSEVTAFNTVLDESWTVISDEQWVELIVQHDKHINW